MKKRSIISQRGEIVVERKKSFVDVYFAMFNEGNIANGIHSCTLSESNNFLFFNLYISLGYL